MQYINDVIVETGPEDLSAAAPAVTMNTLSWINCIVHLVLYHALGKYLPSSTAPGGAVWRALRSWICRPMFISCGENVNVEPRASIGYRTVSIGSNSGIGFRALVGSGSRIGSNVMMGPEVLIYTRNHSIFRTDIPMIEQGDTAIARVVIEDDVWIGARVIILPGVTVGCGSVLGAGAVVSRDVPPYAVVVGNTGRVVRYRNAPPKVT
jgi:maltose O-acetyltransferase